MATQSTLPTVLVLAAGRGERFAASGGRAHKLQALLAGRPVLQHVLDAVNAADLPHHLVQPSPAQPGMGDSIAAGVRATQGAKGWLVLPGDLPLVQPATLRAVAQALAQHHAVVPVCRGQRGHPVGFAAACGPHLAQLAGDTGAARVLQAWGAVELSVHDEGVLIDIDTPHDLAHVQAMLDARSAR
jgi:molybdenum cofactor cytidylyltransferase